MKKTLAFVVIVALSITCALAQSWQKVTPTNQCTNRHENSLTAIGNKLVLVGGRGVKPVESFDIKTNTWTKHVETPLEMSHFQAINYKGEMWVIGAFTGGYPHEVPIPDVYIFNIEKNEWRKGPSIPEDRRRGAAGAFVYKNKIYIICGETDGHWDGTNAWFDEYDPKTDRWRRLADAPHIRDHVGASVVGDKLYLAGGRRSTAKIQQVLNLTEPAVDVYDFRTGKWSTLSEAQNLPTKRAGASSVVLGKKVLIMGGESDAQEESHANVEAFNTQTMQWEILPMLNKGRHGTGAVNVKGKVYTVAGSGNRGGGPELNSIEVFE
ncbi:galactose oxidase [Imperialibacter roseus]|uniref:Galactose oxidase n=1 Tax=Imperialibacter roseus TaxID=1324217 RepID=A0ABZ0IRE8_9BACT|nr:galactose oxidase [Imperialibacter roseus]WOK07151.1 galactose oxidase [Imperialibacter roseus]